MSVVIGVVIYIAIGLIRLISDYMQPRYNQPDYVRNPRWWFTLLVVIMWPILFFNDTVFFYRYYKANCTSKGLRRLLEFFQVVVLHRRVYREREGGKGDRSPTPKSPQRRGKQWK